MPQFSSEITESNARALLYLFYECYRHGVEDASNVNDENKCREYIEAMRRTHEYRLVGHDYEMTWKEWRIRLVMYASRMKGKREMVRKVLLGIDRYGVYYAVTLRAAMEFYVDGVKDFTEYPRYEGLESFFNDTHLRKWQKGFQYALYRNTYNLLEDMTALVYDRVRYDKKISEKKRTGYIIAMTDRTYNLFVELMYTKIMYRSRPEWKQK